jgi:hypothetical protein
VAPGHQTRRITIVPPAGYAFGDLPPAGEELGGEFGRAKLSFKRQGGSVVVERTVIFDLSTIPVDKYAAWRGWLQRVDRLMHRMVRLVPRAGAGGAQPAPRDPLASQPAPPAPPPPGAAAPPKALPGKATPPPATGQPVAPPPSAPPPPAGSSSPVR